MTRIALLSASALALVSFPALAEAEADPAVPDAAHAADAALAVSTFSAATIEARGFDDTLDLMPYVPNAFASHEPGVGSANILFIRGLGNAESVSTFDPAVATLVDGVNIGRQNANNLSFFNVERVDVLRGPQGTLIGRNAIAGAVNVVMRQPGDKLSGLFDLGYGRFDEKRFRASIDIPLDPKFALNVSGYWHGDDGYVKNRTTGERLNDDDGSGIRFAGRLAATERLTWNMSLTKMVSDGENLPNFTCNPGDASDCKGRFATTGLLERQESGTQFEPLAIRGAKAKFDLGNRTDTWLATSNIEWAGDSFTLSAITGWVDLKQKFALDFLDGRAEPILADPNPAVLGLVGGGYALLNDSTHTRFSQEFRLSGRVFGDLVHYVAGVEFSNEDNKTDSADVVDLQALRFAAVSTPALAADRVVSNKTDATAAYLQIDVNPTDRLTLTAGARYTDEKKTIRVADNRAACNDGTIEITCLDSSNLVATSGASIPTKLTDKVWTPNFAATYRASDALTLYASAARGYRSGGWNARAITPQDFLPVGPETAWSFEGGLRSEWFDQRLSLKLTGFFVDASDVQTAELASNVLPPTTTRGGADFENKGFEVELAAVPLAGLNVYANLGWQDAKYKIDRSAPATDAFGVQSVAAQHAACLAQLGAGAIAGGSGPDAALSCGIGIVTADGRIAKPVRAPKWTLSGGASYDFAIPAAGVFVTPAVNAAYRSSAETGTANLSFFEGSVTGPSGTVYPANTASGGFITGSRAESSVLVSASLSLRTDDDAWLVSVECDNCLSETFVESSLGNVSYLNPRMTWTVRARRKF